MVLPWYAKRFVWLKFCGIADADSIATTKKTVILLTDKDSSSGMMYFYLFDISHYIGELIAQCVRYLSELFA